MRLAGIDAPEKAQAFGQRSKQTLSDLVYAKTVSAEISKTDKYGRSIAVIFLDGRDVNLEQVRAGMAWHYKQYQAEQSETERLTYAQAEDTARYSKRGLWVDADPMPPWVWRHGGKPRR